MNRIGVLAAAAILVLPGLRAAEKTVVSLRDFCDRELRSEGIEITHPLRVRITATGGGGEKGWGAEGKSLSAYGWILDARTRRPVWEMDRRNTHRDGEFRKCEEELDLPPGRYEVYFAAPVFSFSSWSSHIIMNVDHRQKPLFGGGGKKGLFEFFKGWWADDAAKAWEKQCGSWGLEITAEAGEAARVKRFTPPAGIPGTLLRVQGKGEGDYIRKGFTLSGPASLFIYALGEGVEQTDLADGAWILDAVSRRRVWDMADRRLEGAGGSAKNRRWEGTVRLEKGEYELVYISDDSHSPLDWNAPPPPDPLLWGVTIAAVDSEGARRFAVSSVRGFANVIAQLVQMRDDESRSAGFTLKQETRLRIYALGERGSSRRRMADYAYITDAKTRERVWTMEVDETSHAGGSPKNRLLDEVITLPAGNYTLTYTTDDSHAYGDWTADPPFDRENYGVTLMGAGERFSPAQVAPFRDEADRNVIARIVRVRDNARKAERFTLDKTTRVRIYAIGEGQNREMYDYGWIEDLATGHVIWEMTYGMTFHAGGHRKNRMVNTTFLLEKGSYKLHFQSDDSHSYGDWNVDPPDDEEYWGITLFRDNGGKVPAPPPPPREPD
ncbi:MAG: hypothetical protein WB626_03160 [Bacteroidota bacterium]